MKNLGNMLKQAQQMQTRMAEMQAKLEATEVEGQAGAGMVKVKLTGGAADARYEVFLQASTSEVYGTARFVPITEEHPLQGQSPYSASKTSADLLALAHFHSADTNRDARLSLVELTRVIELFNTRSGTARTGEYHVLAGTEDGFAPGP